MSVYGDDPLRTSSTPRISGVEATERIRDYIDAKYRDAQLTRATPSPIEMPDGWRFPYDCNKSIYRIRQKRVVFFIRRNGTIHVERDDFTPLQGTACYNSLEMWAKSPPDLISRRDAQERVRANGFDEIVSCESVWSLGGEPESEPKLVWRIDAVRGTSSYLVEIPYDGAPSGIKQERLSRAASRWRLGRASLTQDALKINLKHVSDEVFELSQWIVWSCISHMGRFLYDLNFREINPYLVGVKYVSETEGEGAQFRVELGSPIIRFPRANAWAQDISIVMHELGHAIWELLYTVVPSTIDQNQLPHAVRGVQEGFADYFAACILKKRKPSALIGGALGPIGHNFGLPRIVDGKPKDPVMSIVEGERTPVPIEMQADGNDHKIGAKWANLLWDFRCNVIEMFGGACARDADAVVLAAHTRPRVASPGPALALACYFDSLRFTAADLFTLDDQYWKDLARKHNLALDGLFVPMPSRAVLGTLGLSDEPTTN